MSYATQTTRSAASSEAENQPSPGLETGEFAPRAASPHSPAKLVIATYNIRYAVGSFLITGGLLRRLGVSRPARRASLVNRNITKAARAFMNGLKMPPADLIALQEADRETARAGGRHVARELAALLNMNYARAASPTPDEEEPKPKQWYLDFEERIRRGEQGDTGVALLSRFPLSQAARVELPWTQCPWRPRLAMTASVPFAGGALRVFNAHIDPHAGLDEQLKQHEAVLDYADTVCAGEPCAFVGDFNTLIPAARRATRAYLESRGFTSPMNSGVGTWRAGLLRLHADWIFTRAARVSRWGVARSLGMSDHWPVWAELVSGEAEDA